jgi:hypothetical protein
MTGPTVAVMKERKARGRLRRAWVRLTRQSRPVVVRHQDLNQIQQAAQAVVVNVVPKDIDATVRSPLVLRRSDAITGRSLAKV